MPKNNKGPEQRPEVMNNITNLLDDQHTVHSIAIGIIESVDLACLTARHEGEDYNVFLLHLPNVVHLIFLLARREQELLEEEIVSGTYVPKGGEDNPFF